jgi:DNA-binding response OmpR family regulator
VQGARLYFTEKEYGVVEMLALRADRAVSKEAIAGRLHGVADQRTMRLVDDYVSRIRKKLRFACGGASLIVTHLDRSYIFSSAATSLTS